MKLLSQVNQWLGFSLSPINLEIARSGIASEAPPRTTAGLHWCAFRKKEDPGPSSSLRPAEKRRTRCTSASACSTPTTRFALFVPEHTHIPASRRTPFPGGGELPREYSHTLDPFVALAYAAAVTTRLKLGTGICLIIERDTIITAKEVASLDFVSNGRFLFGVGGGWNLEEMENHGTDPRTRFKRLEEQIRAMKEIWTRDPAAFHGEHIRFDPIWMHPKPVQKPHPPVLLGGESGHTLQRVVDFCDGWFPRGRGGDVILTGLPDLKPPAPRAGR